MKGIDLLIGSFGWAIVHSIWQILLIALAIRFALFILKDSNAKVKYNLVLGGLLTASILFGITLLLSANQLSGYAKNPTEIYPKAMGLSASFPEQADAQPFQQPTGNSWSVRATIQGSLGYITALWLAGFLFFMLRFSGSYVFIHRLKNRYSFEVRSPWQTVLQRIQKRLGFRKQIALLESAMTSVPLVIGHFRPVIILPVGLVTHVPFNQVEAILVHELAHIRRNDFLVNLLVSAMEWIFFYHPLFWWLSRKLETFREHCCDDVTVAYCGHPGPLQKALLDLSALNHKPPYIAAALYKNENQLLNRIKRMKSQNQKNHGTHVNPVALVLILGLLITGLAGSSLSPNKGDVWQSMSLIPTFPRQETTVTDVSPVIPEPVSIAQKPDTTTKKDQAGTVKEFEDNGIISLELDGEGNLVGVKKDGKELTGTEREKYEKLALKLKQLKEEEKALEKNREELQKARKRLKETEEKMKDVQQEYNQAMKEYFQKQSETGWRAYDSAWGLYGEQILKAEELSNLMEQQQDLAGIYKRDFFENQEHWADMHDDMIRDRLANQDNWTVHQDLIEDQYRISQEQLQKTMQEYEWQNALQNEQLQQKVEEMKQLEEMKKIEMDAHRFEEAVRHELVRDGILGKPGDKLAFKLSGKRLIVNGKKQTADMRDKYLRLYDKYTDTELSADTQVIIED